MYLAGLYSTNKQGIRIQMKLRNVTMAACALSVSLFAAESTLNLEDQKEKTSYALGENFGNNLRNQGVEVNVDTVLKGIQDGLANQGKLNEQQMRETFTALSAQVRTRMQEKAKANKAEGEKFLAENAKKEGIHTLPGGLQYRIIKEGSGESPKTNDEVSVKYTGKLLDGTVFDSTSKRNDQPARFRVNGVIKGWTEALTMMKKGAEWELFIPAELAYGERGGPAIPGNSVLHFTVELLDIFPAPTPPPPPGAAAGNQQVTSDIIKVPSAEELKKGAKIEVLKPEDVQKEIEKEKARKEAEAKKK
jgi:FKBP-type peptidyl-prolyl cis-trans isomerase FklB